MGICRQQLQTIGGKTNEIYGDDRTIDIMGNYTKTIKKNSTEDVIGNIEITTFGHYECVVNDNITFITKKGNWTVRTEGLFELFDSIRKTCISYLNIDSKDEAGNSENFKRNFNYYEEYFKLYFYKVLVEK